MSTHLTPHEEQLLRTVVLPRLQELVDRCDAYADREKRRADKRAKKDGTFANFRENLDPEGNKGARDPGSSPMNRQPVWPKEALDSREKGPQKIHGQPDSMKGPTWADVHLTRPGKSPSQPHEYQMQRLERQMPKDADDPDYDEFVEERMKYDSAFNALGVESPWPRQQECLNGYRIRMANDLRQHSPKFKTFNSFDTLPVTVFNKFEPELLQSVCDEAAAPIMVPKGQLIEKVRTDQSWEAFHRILRGTNYLDAIVHERAKKIDRYSRREHDRLSS